MPVLKLTKRSVDALAPSDKAYSSPATRILRASACRVYASRRKVMGRSTTGRTGGGAVFAKKRVTLGNTRS